MIRNRKTNITNRETNEIRASFMADWDDAWVIEWNELTGEMFDENLETRGNAVSDQIDALFLALESKNPNFLKQEVDKISCNKCNRISEPGPTCPDCGSNSRVTKIKVFIDRLSDDNQWNLRAENLISTIIGNMRGEE